MRQRLKQMQVWPEAGDLFLELLHESRWVSPPPSEADNEWLPLVVRDAIDGKDIGSLYPAFFQKLVANDRLCQVFLDELDKRQKE